MLKLILPVAMLAAITPQIAAAQATDPTPAIKERYATLPNLTDDTKLYETFGRREGLVAIMDDFMNRLVANPRTRPYFENSDKERIKALLVEQVCVVLKGPCTYSGRSMAEAHMGMNVNEGAFFALVEEFQKTLNARNIPFAAQNRLIASLTPMHRDIIDR
ncbi:group I truncated hemoglobin [Sphingomonas crocodyli]|uniref:Group 1 truncated hemoglobin n=1 Tax=Sphingomonas crocodyli TaxID=1979270 RepID=A0A437M6G7_9SPHN|nr:group 1 truncated hemoglobin [Sphingomonas crocodyli]RVT93310.1 group 1 truncated hemoglobin [Sphingomonas crocodyli]